MRRPRAGRRPNLHRTEISPLRRWPYIHRANFHKQGEPGAWKRPPCAMLINPPREFLRFDLKSDEYSVVPGGFPAALLPVGLAAPPDRGRGGLPPGLVLADQQLGDAREPGIAPTLNSKFLCFGFGSLLGLRQQIFGQIELKRARH